MTRVSTSKISPARIAAFEVLAAVRGGAFASDALRDRTAALASRDAGLASQIVFGCLRRQSQLDFLISQYSGHPAGRLDTVVAIALRAAIFQLRYLERIPPHAAVDESVEWVKRQKRAAAGFTNAVLRKVNREPVAWPDLATELSCPQWLLERWASHFGSVTAREIAKAALIEPLPYVRAMRLHDIGSQAIVPLLDLQPGLAYLDLCAAPGNKTLQALETRLSLAVACDISLKRIREIPPVCPRVVLDAAAPLPFNRHFDRIFIDAPCSGTGTLARNPEIKWRLQAPDCARFAQKQARIVSNALPFLAPGGKLLYATCSLESEENEDVIRGILANHPDLHCERELWRLPGREEGDGFYAAALRKPSSLATSTDLEVS
ncbi:MAG: transcription antitermination factor NusB [Bryobacteraceae bacterium]